MVANPIDNPAVEPVVKKMPENLVYQYPVGIVNINGTSKDELVAAKARAAFKLDEALALINLAFPHGRDYQFNKPRECELAQAFYRRMYEAVKDVRDAIEAEAEILNDQ